MKFRGPERTRDANGLELGEQEAPRRPAAPVLIDRSETGEPSCCLIGDRSSESVGSVMMVGIMSAEEPKPPARFMSLDVAAVELATTRSQIYALLRSGELKGIQIGGRNQWRIERVKLEEFIAEAYRRAETTLKELPDDVTEGDS